MTTATTYSATTAYTAGQTVVLNGVTYQANWWVSGSDPSLNNGGPGSGQAWTIVSGSSTTPVAPVNPAAPSVTAPPATSTSTYSASAVYTAGQIVILNGVTYQANWWTTGSDPAQNSGAVGSGKVWTIVSTGSSSSATPVITPVQPPANVTPAPVITPTPVVTPTPSVTPASDPVAYSATAVYTAGQLVTLNGLTYRANWWTTGSDPAQNSGATGSGQVWTLIGPTSLTAPNAPINFVVNNTSSSSVTLSWASGGGYATSYAIFENGTQVATTTSTTTSITGLTPSTSYNFSVEAINAYGTSSITPSIAVTTSVASATTGVHPIFSPYVDMTLTSGQNVVQMAHDAGLKDVTLAFIQSNGNGGIGWGGSGTITNDVFSNGSNVLTAIQGLHAAGVNVTISFGGAAGQDAAATATSASQLQAEYQSVIDRYGVKSLDFDIEGAVSSNAAANKLRDQALKALEAANPDVHISYTIATMPTGLVSEGMNLLATALADGVRIDTVNVMAMDYGSASDNGGKMGLNAILAIQSVEGQLNSLGMTSTKVGVTPMIGMNDTSTEIFTLADAQQLVSYAATDPRVAEISMWSLARDNGTGAGATWASPTSSSISQTPYQFSVILGSHS